MERLNKHDISEIKKVFNSYNDETLSALAVTLSKLGLDCIDTIEAQQQEIDQMAKLHQMAEENCERLVADKDEQSGRIMKQDTEIKRLRKIIGIVENCEPDGAEIIREAFQTVLGGKEDV